MSAITDGFAQLCERLTKVDLFGGGPPAVPWREDRTPTVEELDGVLVKPGELLPLVYRKDYVEPLRAHLPSLVAQLGQRVSATVLEALAGAVYDHDPGSGVQAELHRFLAVVSDLFTSFLSAERRAQIDVPLSERLPPLAVYQSRGTHGPFTIAADVTARVIGSNVGVVSLPSSYRAHPVLWTALVHETAGHDVTHADLGLLPELAERVERLFGGPYPPSEKPEGEQLEALVWSYWIDQTTADIYGVLNAGPAFAFGLAVFFAALDARVHPDQPSPRLRARSGSGAADLLDPHPPDLLRIPLAMGVIQSLRRFDAGARARYLAQLEEIEEACRQGAKEITLTGAVPLDASTALPLDVRVPLAAWREDARHVGELVGAARLDALAGHAIQDIETWDDPDEATAQRIRAALAKDTGVAHAGNDAQLLAGATLALLDDPSRYDAVTARLNEALDESFATDPIWGKVLIDRVYVP